MTNLNKLYALYNIDIHKEQETLKDLLVNHLPKEYTSKVMDKLNTNEIIVDSQTVRNTKAGISKNILVFNAIIEVAKEYKAMSNRLKKNLKSDT
ncbi:hypothetical protein Q4Q34_11095 [Flavivirga abyssicola]|uniref:hypothetical protein n=1 Tax=Flavivirga abyssicola TaxID=3063533 RepID=UPI0026DFC742|nr:hypothetical protein [Flavivirga sp. MEBiC07777]WVK11770.1 hypothetical protein Q4Q34_11095 [Flavivirga sp. MEBiC07777]